MRNRFRILLTVIVMIVVTVFAWQVLKPREPSYHGKTLSGWLAQMEAANNLVSPTHEPPRSSARWLEASNAVRQIGTNAVPTLLAMLETSESPMKLKFFRVASKFRLLDQQNATLGWRDVPAIHYLPEYVAHARACAGFEILGADASNAVPEIMRFYRTGPPLQIQILAIQSLADIGPPASNAVPLLIETTTNVQTITRLLAMNALGKIRAEPRIVIPLLIKILLDANEIQSIRLTATLAIEDYGVAAKPFAPDLAAALHQLEQDDQVMPPSPDRRNLLRHIKQVLHKIDPETAVDEMPDATSEKNEAPAGT